MSSSEGEVSANDTTKRQSKKRRRNVDEWKNNKRKHARLAGKSYVSTTGKLVDAKTTGSPCR